MPSFRTGEVSSDEQEEPDVQEPEDRPVDGPVEWFEPAAPIASLRADPRWAVQEAQIVVGAPTCADGGPGADRRAGPRRPSAPGAQRIGTGRSVSGATATRARSADRGGLRNRLSREAVGIAVLLVLALICGGLIAAVVVKTRDDAAMATREAEAYTPPALPTATPSPSATGPVIAIVGDEALIRASSTVTAEQRWTTLTGKALGARVVALASIGAGYSNGGADDADFAAAAARVPSSAKVVLFVGGGADASEPSLAVAQAATEAFSVASRRAPDATLVAIGPLFRSAGTSAADSAALRSSLRSAARIAGVDWVDPVESGWLNGVNAPVDLSVADERTISIRVRAVLKPLLD